MAKRIKSGLKRKRQNEVRRLRNRAVRTRVRNAVKALRQAIGLGEPKAVSALLPKTVSVIDVGVRKGVFHKNTGARLKSRLLSQAAALLKRA
ncbi:MAG: 30S ribosomal protein S20 [Thermoanaerobaculum sp.]|nr:30S ribosomal protein S20 [Thermoanaerobaculum sp.]MCX7895185.1 30S ribosomal protein S20 [Thermoanaerobaculum sp.]MDW7966515.1 30S ribosomal protein S20 [Thermoanaerobaculum sp.]